MSYGIESDRKIMTFINDQVKLNSIQYPQRDQIYDVFGKILYEKEYSLDFFVVISISTFIKSS